MSGVFRVHVRMDIDPAEGAAFEDTWRAVADVIAAEPANRGQWLCRDAAEPHRYTVVSDWTGETEFRRFETSAAHVAHRRALAPFRRGGDMTTMTVLAHHGPHAPYRRD